MNHRSARDSQSNGLGMSERLEAHARVLAHRLDQSDSIIAKLQREIAFTLEQLDLARNLQREIAKDLLRAECSIGTQLSQLSPHEPLAREYRINPQEKVSNAFRHDRLKTQQRALHEEKRRLALKYREDIHRLQTKLLELVEQHTQLTDFD